MTLYKNDSNDTQNVGNKGTNISRKDVKLFKKHTQSLKKKQQKVFKQQERFDNERYKGQYVLEKHVPIWHFIFLKESQRYAIDQNKGTKVRKMSLKQMYEQGENSINVGRSKELRILVKHHKVANAIGVTGVAFICLLCFGSILTSTTTFKNITSQNQNVVEQPKRLSTNEFIVVNDKTDESTKGEQKEKEGYNKENKVMSSKEKARIYNKYIKQKGKVKVKGKKPINQEIYDMTSNKPT